MEVSFSLNPHARSLVSLTPLSSSSSSSSFSLVSPCSRVRSLRKEFLGCGHNLRPQGLGSRRKCRKLGFLVHPPRIILRASLNWQSMLVVVSAFTVSALTVLYLNYTSKTNKHAKKISGFRDIQEDTSASENKVSIKEMRKICHNSRDEVVLLRFKETAVMHKETLITDSLKSEVANISSLPSSHYKTGALPFSFATETLEMPLEGCEQETGFGSHLHMPVIQADPITTWVPSNNAQAGVQELEKPNHEVVEETEISSYDGIRGESVRKELYTFYEEKQSAMRSVGTINGLRSISSNGFLQHNNSFSSSKSSAVGTKLFAPDFLHTAENFEGKLPLGHYEKGSLHKGTDLGETPGFHSDKEKKNMRKNNHVKLFPSRHSKVKRINNRNYPSDQLSAYNRFLRDGRLIDCVELLEDMEEKGLLNMDKVYHAGFFRVCKVQKAVKEAFRFTKLIPNPTLSTFNMLVSVCASSQDSDGAFQVVKLVQEAGLKADCKLYTTLVSTCAKCGKVDMMFKVFHEMVNAGVEPNVHTYGALIDGCAKAGQVAKAFGAYGIMRSKNVKPDRVVFNALINACGRSGAVARAFDVLAEMRAENHPIDPDHVTVGALIKACANAGQVDRAREVYNMIHESNIKGTPEVYTIAVNSCSQTGDWEFAHSVYNDMRKKGVVPDEMFISSLIDVAGHAGNLDAAFEVVQEARTAGMHVGIISYSSLMGACSKMKNWQKALELYDDIKTMSLKPTVPTMNALITALCDGNQLQKAVEVLFEMKKIGLRPNAITYSILFVASEKKDDLEAGLMLFSQMKKDGVAPNLVMCRCLSAMCLRRFEKSHAHGEPVLSFNSGRLQIDNKWTSLVLMFYRETITAGVVPTIGEISQVLGCLRLPHDVSLRNRLIESLGVCIDISKSSNLCSLIDGFGEYDPRAFSLLEEAASLGIVSCVSLKETPIVVDVRKFQVHTAEVYLLTVLKGLKHRLAAGVKLPNITILLPTEKTQVQSSTGKKTVNLSGRVSQAIAALLRRLGLSYLGNESLGRIRINGIVVRKWFQPRIDAPFSGKPTDFRSAESRLGRAIKYQQRSIRTDSLSLE
ncbi:hypothetical protein LguiB_007281 [Lonicera macranthoides]